MAALSDLPARLETMPRHRIVADFEDGDMVGFHAEVHPDGELVKVEDLAAALVGAEPSAYEFMAEARRTTAACVETIERLARTYANPPMPLTDDERADLRSAASLLRIPAVEAAPQVQQDVDNALACAAENQDGASLIRAERTRQRAVEGWTPEHDGEHDDFQLSDAAFCYAQAAYQLDQYPGKQVPRPVRWPWDREWWKPGTDPVRALVKAGALLDAEIDRLQRALVGAEPSADPLWCAESNRLDNPALEGCTGKGRPSCDATECFFGVESCPVCGKAKAVGSACAFCPAPFLLKVDDLRASFHRPSQTVHIGTYSVSAAHARRIAEDILELLPAPPGAAAPRVGAPADAQEKHDAFGRLTTAARLEFAIKAGAPNSDLLHCALNEIRQQEQK